MLSVADARPANPPLPKSSSISRKSPAHSHPPAESFFFPHHTSPASQPRSSVASGRPSLVRPNPRQLPFRTPSAVPAPTSSPNSLPLPRDLPRARPSPLPPPAPAPPNASPASCACLVFPLQSPAR